MHMLHVHGRPEWRYKCNCCDRDTLVKDDKAEDIIAVEKKALCDKVEEVKEDETSHQTEVSDVTSVRDDRDYENQHFEEGTEAIEAENNAVKEISKPVGILLP